MANDCRVRKLLIASDFHLSTALTYQCLSLLQEVDAFIYLGDYCDRAGIDANWYNGCHPSGKHEIRLLLDFMRSVDRLRIPCLFVAGNHDPEANYMPWALRNWQVFHKPTRLVWCGLDVQVYPTGYYPMNRVPPLPPPLRIEHTPEKVDLLLSHELIRGYEQYYTPSLYAHGHVHQHVHQWGEGYLNAACGCYIIDI